MKVDTPKSDCEKLEGTFDLTRQKRAIKKLDAHLLKKADIARRELEAAGSRIEEDIPESHWWWYLEKVVGKPTEAVSLHRAAYMEGSASVSPVPPAEG